MQDYTHAEEIVGVPALLLAAIHYRESNLHKGYYSKKRKKVVKNIGGPFMLDLGPLNDGAEFIKRIRWYEKMLFRLYEGRGSAPKVSHNFSFAVLIAAHHLKLKSHDPITTGECTALLTGKDDCLFETSECVAYAVWGYNGRASWHKADHRNSSYVWNDPKNGKVLMMRYRKKDGTLKEFLDTRPGVMIIYRELVELFKVKE